MTDIKQNIPSGYKQTEIGVIPKDWDLCLLGDKTLKIGSGVTPTGGESVYKKHGRPFVRSQNIGWGELSLNDIAYIDDEIHQTFPNTEIKPKDVFLNISGASIGRSAIANNKLVGGNVNQHVCIIRVIEKQLDPQYLNIFLLSNNGQKQIDSFQSGGNRQGLNIGQIKTFQITLPPKPEQTAIAAVLSDTDVLIENLEKLIAKKKTIKQGAMQQLLTGKKRLPGFSGEWIRKKIGEIGEVTGSGVDKKTSPEEIPVRLVNFLNVYHQSFIYSKNLNHFVTARPDQIVRCSVKKGDVFFTPSSEMPYDVGLSAVAMEDMPDVVYSYHVDRLRLFKDWDLLFRAYIFQTKDFSDQTTTQCEGSGKRYVLNLTTFRERLTVYYPTDKKEQSAIAAVLSDMDAEIGKLENKLNKYRQIKIGMMQKLLTGKIRLLKAIN